MLGLVDLDVVLVEVKGASNVRVGSAVLGTPASEGTFLRILDRLGEVDVAGLVAEGVVFGVLRSLDTAAGMRSIMGTRGGFSEAAKHLEQRVTADVLDRFVGRF